MEVIQKKTTIDLGLQKYTITLFSLQNSAFRKYETNKNKSLRDEECNPMYTSLGGGSVLPELQNQQDSQYNNLGLLSFSDKIKKEVLEL